MASRRQWVSGPRQPPWNKSPDEPIRTAFVRWFRKFKPQEDQRTVMILSLGKVGDVQVQKSASPGETQDSHDRDKLTAA